MPIETRNPNLVENDRVRQIKENRRTLKSLDELFRSPDLTEQQRQSLSRQIQDLNAQYEAIRIKMPTTGIPGGTTPAIQYGETPVSRGDTPGTTAYQRYFIKPQEQDTGNPGRPIPERPTPGPTPIPDNVRRPVPDPDRTPRPVPNRPDRGEGTSQNVISETEKNKALDIIKNAINKFGEKSRASAEYIRKNLSEILILALIAAGVIAGEAYLLDKAKEQAQQRNWSTSYYDLYGRKPSVTQEQAELRETIEAGSRGEQPEFRSPVIAKISNDEINSWLADAQPSPDEYAKGKSEAQINLRMAQIQEAIQNPSGSKYEASIGMDVGSVYTKAYGKETLAIVNKGNDGKRVSDLLNKGELFAWVVEVDGQILDVTPYLVAQPDGSVTVDTEKLVAKTGLAETDVKYFSYGGKGHQAGTVRDFGKILEEGASS